MISCSKTIRGRVARRLGSILIAGTCGALALLADSPGERLEASAEVVKASLDAPDRGIPEDLLNDAHCVVIVPSLKKLAFGVGGQYGRGFAVCRNRRNNAWGAPGAVRVEGGSFGFQIGGSETDVVMLIMDPASMKSVLADKFTLGGSAEVAAGPVGRAASADTSARMKAKILTYSRSHGIFAGVSLSGATLRNDSKVNRQLYRRRLHNRDILLKDIKPPAAAGGLLTLLRHYSPHEESRR